MTHTDYIADVVYMEGDTLVHDQIRFRLSLQQDNGTIRLFDVTHNPGLNPVTDWIENFRVGTSLYVIVLEKHWPVWSRPIGVPIRRGQIDTITFKPRSL